MRAVLVAGLWLGLGLAGVAVGPTFAEGRCDAPMSEWKSRDALERAVMGLGWTMQRLRSDHGCYMVAARDQNGTAILAEFLPETLELLSVEVDRDASACAAPVAAREGKSGGNRDDHADADRGQDD